MFVVNVEFCNVNFDEVLLNILLVVMRVPLCVICCLEKERKILMHGIIRSYKFCDCRHYVPEYPRSLLEKAILFADFIFYYLVFFEFIFLKIDMRTVVELRRNLSFTIR